MAGGWGSQSRQSPSDAAWCVESGKPKEKSVFKRLSAAFRSKTSKTPVEGIPPSEHSDLHEHGLPNRSETIHSSRHHQMMRPACMSALPDHVGIESVLESPYAGRDNSLPFGTVDWSPARDRWSSDMSLDASTMSIRSSIRHGVSSSSPSFVERTPSWSSHFTGTPASNTSTPRLPQHCLVTAEASCGVPSCGSNDIELFMMYASPLNHESIDVASEVEVLNEAIQESSAQIQLNVGVATAGSLNKLLTLARSRRGLVLHLSAHAVEGKNPGEIGLVLEDAKGYAHILWREDLEELLGMREQGLRNISLLFLSTCYSERLAQVFIECGCRHVVAVRTKVHDTAAQKFSQQFYLSLAVNDSLLVAWEGARRALRIDPDKSFAAQAEDFVLFGQHGAERVTLSILCGQEQPMAPASQLGDFESAAVVLKASQARTSRAEHFVGRVANVYDLMTAFSPPRGRRACAIHGMEGIGKSALGAEFARFASAPGRLFSCASIIVRCETSDLDSLVNALEEQLQSLSAQLRVPLRTMSGSSRASERSFYSHQDSRPGSVCSARSSASGNSFDNASDDPLQFLLPARTRIRRGFKDMERLRGRSARVLLVIDDVAGVISSSSEARRLLGDLLENTQRLSVLVLSRQPVYNSLGSAKVANIHLEGLDRKEAARLFLQRVHRPLESADFFPTDTSAPVHGPGPGGGPGRFQRTQLEQIYEKMSEHPLICRLAGHPGRIRAMSSRVTPGGPSLLTLLANFSEQDLDASPSWRPGGNDDEEMTFDGMTKPGYAMLPGAQQSPCVDNATNSLPSSGTSPFGF